jgi:hypothetical protein
VVPLDVEVPVAAGRDLSLCNVSDVDVVVIKETVLLASTKVVEVFD